MTIDDPRWSLNTGGYYKKFQWVVQAQIFKPKKLFKTHDLAKEKELYKYFSVIFPVQRR